MPGEYLSEQKPNLNKFTSYTLNKNYTVAIKGKWFLACAIEIALKFNRNISIRRTIGQVAGHQINLEKEGVQDKIK